MRDLIVSVPDHCLSFLLFSTHRNGLQLEPEKAGWGTIEWGTICGVG